MNFYSATFVYISENIFDGTKTHDIESTILDESIFDVVTFDKWSIINKNKRTKMFYLYPIMISILLLLELYWMFGIVILIALFHLTDIYNENVKEIAKEKNNFEYKNERRISTVNKILSFKLVPHPQFYRKAIYAIRKSKYISEETENTYIKSWGAMFANIEDVLLKKMIKNYDEANKRLNDYLEELPTMLTNVIVQSKLFYKSKHDKYQAIFIQCKEVGVCRVLNEDILFKNVFSYTDDINLDYEVCVLPFAFIDSILISHFVAFKSTKDRIDILLRNQDSFNEEYGLDMILTKVKNISGIQFERFIYHYLDVIGMKNVYITPSSNDGGIDVIYSDQSIKCGVQCKRYKDKIGVSVVRETYAGKDIHKLSKVKIITTSSFTDSAIREAKILSGIELVSYSDFSEEFRNRIKGRSKILLSKLKFMKDEYMRFTNLVVDPITGDTIDAKTYDPVSIKYNSIVSKSHIVQKVKKTKRIDYKKICPKCGNQLIRRKGYRGSFWGCKSYPMCSYTKKTLNG